MQTLNAYFRNSRRSWIPWWEHHDPTGPMIRVDWDLFRHDPAPNLQLTRRMKSRPPHRIPNWFQTYTGLRFFPFAPTSQMIQLQDIAQGLSMTCRFNGQIDEFYSVAQHSVHVASIVTRAGGSRLEALTGLLHDATEAYISDVVKPAKDGLRDYQELEARIWAAIAERFGLLVKLSNNIKVADRIALSTEKRDLIRCHGHDWGTLPEPDVAPITPLSPRRARILFLQMFDHLL